MHLHSTNKSINSPASNLKFISPSRQNKLREQTPGKIAKLLLMMPSVPITTKVLPKFINQLLNIIIHYTSSPGTALCSRSMTGSLLGEERTVVLLVRDISFGSMFPLINTIRN
ncbi:hypothetical protein CEXT_316111 [Caerostris extrusa]|uniref:Uncharacterized protein n=1 Tax=Caerostris extrusa TaxID=172846 RepID=A0AAV4MKP6_CAEEX|nr:hypothetical protein CEXT_316111 [Caerostris extrusa]